MNKKVFYCAIFYLLWGALVAKCINTVHVNEKKVPHPTKGWEKTRIYICAVKASEGGSFTSPHRLCKNGGCHQSDHYTT